MYKSLIEGQEVQLDKEHANTSKVTVVSQTPLRLYTTVKNDINTWSVMTDRLTEIK